MVDDANTVHPSEKYVKFDVTPPVWCAGCGIGTVVNTFIKTVEKLAFDPERICVVAGNGCTGKVVEYLRLGSPRIATGNVIRYALALKQQHLDEPMVVFMNDTDFFNSDSRGIFEIGARNGNFVVIYVNNYIHYTLVLHRGMLNTPFMGVPLGHGEGSPFNTPHMAKRAGAGLVVRWTQLHIRRLMYSLTDALRMPGFSFIEIISPCLMFYASSGVVGQKIDRLEYLKDRSVIKNGEPTENLDIRDNDRIIVGKFVSELKE